jgi:hypothetical protein
VETNDYMGKKKAFSPIRDQEGMEAGASERPGNSSNSRALRDQQGKVPSYSLHVSDQKPCIARPGYSETGRGAEQKSQGEQDIDVMPVSPDRGLERTRIAVEELN